MNHYPQLDDVHGIGHSWSQSNTTGNTTNLMHSQNQDISLEHSNLIDARQSGKYNALK